LEHVDGKFFYLNEALQRALRNDWTHVLF
jgi:hypothetical protein